MKNILCFGDSNTWGVNPDNNGRWDYSERWTGRLSALLGPEYHIYEEGLCGRNTIFSDPTNENRRALDTLPVALETHSPLDLVIIMLGTNDTKVYYNASAKVSARGILRLIETIQKHTYFPLDVKPKILIVSPIYIDYGCGDIPGCISYDDTSAEKSRNLAKYYKEVADSQGSFFFDAATVAKAGKDKMHMNGDSHKALSEALYPIVKNILDK